jgi:hypothetical protein
MTKNLNFNACRKCLKSGTIIELSSLFDLPGEIEKFEEIAEVQVNKPKKI